MPSQEKEVVSEYLSRKLEGGLFLKGVRKESLISTPLISVITVVFNDVKHLEATIKSVIEQTYPNIEYIVVDGGSTDGTIDILKKYEGVIDYWLSEKDAGIYDAMNKGIDIARGEWINFMNAGDVFAVNNVVEKIFSQRNLDAQLIYGNHIVDYGDFCKLKIAGPLKKIWKGMQFSHQSVFVSAKVQKNYLFRLEYNIAADFDVIFTLYSLGNKFHYIDTAISKITSDGLSDANRMNSIKQIEEIVSKHNNHLIIHLYYNYYKYIEMLKSIIKKRLSERIVKLLQRVK